MGAGAWFQPIAALTIYNMIKRSHAANKTKNTTKSNKIKQK